VTAVAAAVVELVREGRALPFARTQPDPRVRAAVAVSGRLPWFAPSEPFLDRALHALSTSKPALDPALGRLESDGIW
jgi:hypothetical protein